jgi:hypothetical protein
VGRLPEDDLPLVENIEFFLVARPIVILGWRTRTYFVQPFKIPTNSMWPTYNGMTGQNYTLFRNGEPITGSSAFDKNARRADNYVGYRNERDLSAGQVMTVPADSFAALGDNSANSEDSRFWGYIPAREAIGRPLFIYYPFTSRWGPAR